MKGVCRKVPAQAQAQRAQAAMCTTPQPCTSQRVECFCWADTSWSATGMLCNHAPNAQGAGGRAHAVDAPCCCAWLAQRDCHLCGSVPSGSIQVPRHSSELNIAAQHPDCASREPRAPAPVSVLSVSAFGAAGKQCATSVTLRARGSPLTRAPGRGARPTAPPPLALGRPPWACLRVPCELFAGTPAFAGVDIPSRKSQKVQGSEGPAANQATAAAANAYRSQTQVGQSSPRLGPAMALHTVSLGLNMALLTALRLNRCHST